MTTYTTNGGQGQGGYPQDILNGRGQGRGNTDQLGAGQAQVVEGLTLQGTVVSVDNTNGKSVVLRDATGRPGWSGRGQRNGG